MRQPKRKRNAGAPTFRNSIKSKFRKSKFRKIEVSKSNKSKRLHFDKAECFGGVNLLRSLPLVRPTGSAFEVLSKAQSQKLKLQVPQKYADCFCFQSIRGVSPQINVGGYVHWTAIISFVLRVRWNCANGFAYSSPDSLFRRTEVINMPYLCRRNWVESWICG